MDVLIYKCLSKQEFALGEYSLVPIREVDRYCIMDWRNAQMDILRQSRPLSREDQDNYFNRIVLPLFDADWPSQLLFSFLREGHLIGYGGLVYLNWLDKRAEVSFLLD